MKRSKRWVGWTTGWMVTAALILAGCCKEPSGKSSSGTDGASAGSSPPVKTAPQPTTPKGRTGFKLRFGPVVSATDPTLTDFSTKLPVGYMGMKLETDKDGFEDPQIDVRLYRIGDQGSPAIVTQKLSTLSTTDNVFYKSWKMNKGGLYEVKVLDPKDSSLIISGRFTIVE